MKPKVVVAESIAPAGIDALAASCEVDVAVGVDREELLGRLAGAHGLVVRSATQVDRQMIEAAPQLRVIGRAGIGVDNIDLPVATSRGVLVVNAPHANTISAAEHTLALLLSQARNIPQAHGALVRGSWDRKSYQGVELHGKTLGVIGLGKIGTLVAQRALAFGMRVVAYDPFVSDERGRRLGVDILALDDLFAVADFITIHLPKTKETEGLLGAENLAKLKPGVRIVNTSRGGIIDEDALADSVASGHVGGAALDVFAVEPLTESRLFELPSVVLTPHLGASTTEAQDKAGTDVAAAVAAALAGELVLSAVNVDLGREVGEDVRAFLPLAERLGKAFVGLGRDLSASITLRAEGRLADYDLKPIRLAVVKGLLSGVSAEPVTYVNASRIAEERGLRIDLEASSETDEYISVLRLSGTFEDHEVSLAGTIARKGPMLVDIMGHEVELPLSEHMAIVRNADTPGVIGRVGTYLGQERVNIANMVVGRSVITGESALMGLNLDEAMTDTQVEALRSLPGIIEATYLEL
ncbi:MAG TPA: phosphoglycerate dehydrogenase [Acidimicrobiia bacterium]